MPNGGESSNLSRVVGAFSFPSGPSAVVCHGQDCPNGERCFPITSEFGLCSPATFTEATECAVKSGSNDKPDECGCDNLSCPADHLCRAEEQTCSCAPSYFNHCVERPCETPADCGQDVCVPSAWIFGSRCFTPKCRGDADCDAGMRCVVVIDSPTQAGEERFGGTQCVLN
jgi:hypothetical protein